MIAALIMCALVTFSLPLNALACATCGCSEVCPIAMMETESAGGKSSSLTDSIWGNIILKMAFQRDPEIQKLARRLNIANFGSYNALTTIAGGTLAQGIVSMATLNPPDGIEDSYVPGSIGLALDALTNIVFTGRTVANFGYKKKLKARQLAIKDHVETLLHHLEFSETKCSEAQTELATLIGDRGAQECLQLWQSSHVNGSILPRDN
jgi:hypothetical protein